ncbi:class I SAM-dependent methyltransferase [Amycolatopsis sp. H20-H5]|uniref:class I SAM-dependent methyltransferase n=1 Tax=Amycolatopsis sp. H20-H5 TaxID=3046309 RepID=UPI002DBBEE37|nr:class I SAM-dependent methyltransferase [Amycolatopsis sp. H20-H5]MEC3981815.1 class I SAM-dependent methyltransferase [Amycolatopsis sp. H20-H5]
MDNETKRRPVVDLELIRGLYREHADALRSVRESRRAHRAAHPSLKVQLDDVEAEISYLLLRHFRPAKVVEIGSLHGWSTGWILHALKDNGTGILITMDLIDNATSGVPKSLAEGRWEFRQCDARNQPAGWADGLDYLFIDADHSARFARWYLRDVFPRLAKGTPVSVHDVFHRAKPLPFTEGVEVLSWLYLHATPYFTAARAKAPLVARAELADLRRELGLGPDLHHGRDNPMIYFRLR